MMLRLLPICSFLLLAHFSFSQNFREGYIRLKGGQDQPGLIGDVKPDIPETVEYKANESSDIVIYKANEIEGYGINNGIYYTAFQEPNHPDDWKFVELLVSGGDITLIRKNSMYFVLPRSRNEFIHLTDNKYRAILSSFMSNCPWVASRSGKVKLTKTSLTDHVKAYNECVAIKNPNLDGMQRPVSFGLVAGCDITTTKFASATAVSTRYLSGEPLHDKSFMQAGVDVTFRTYRVSNFLGLYLGALYNSNSYKTISKVVTTSSTEVNEFSIKYTQLKFPIGLDFSRPSRKRTLFHARVGVVVPAMISLSSTHPWHEIDPRSDGNIYYEEPAKLLSITNKTMLMGAFGFDYKVSTTGKVRLQLNVSRGTTYATAATGTSKDNITGKTTSLSIMAGYIF